MSGRVGCRKLQKKKKHKQTISLRRVYTYFLSSNSTYLSRWRV